MSIINEIRNSPILQKEKDFFKQHKKSFTRIFQYFYKEYYGCDYCILNPETIAENLYNALFNTKQDYYEKQLCSLHRLKENGVDVGFLMAETSNNLLEEFLEQDLDEKKALKRTKELVELLRKQINFVKKFLDSKELSSFDERTFDMSTNVKKQNKNIAYLKNLNSLGRDIKFFIHTEIGTTAHMTKIEQVGNNSIVIKVTDEQMSSLKLSNTAFILKNSEDEKDLSVRARILCAKDRAVVLEDIKELDTMPLLSRRYPRAAIIHACLVHLANENEYISGNMIDISEGGIGVMSSSKSSFEKGQDIVAFVSYEDKDSGFRFNFEASGYVASIIGEKSAFRYGISLNLSDNEKELIKNLINS